MPKTHTSNGKTFTQIALYVDDDTLTYIEAYAKAHGIISTKTRCKGQLNRSGAAGALLAFGIERMKMRDKLRMEMEVKKNER